MLRLAAGERTVSSILKVVTPPIRRSSKVRGLLGKILTLLVCLGLAIAIDSAATIALAADASQLVASEVPNMLLGSQAVRAAVDDDRSVTRSVAVRGLNPSELSVFQPPSANAGRSSQPSIVLEVEVTYVGRPYGSYEVYLNLPRDREAVEAAMQDIDTYFAGAMNFFVLESDRPQTKTFQFDITDELLRQSQTLPEFDANSISVSVLKRGGPAGESITANGLKIYKE